jgi:hypothetical protein
MSIKRYASLVGMMMLVWMVDTVMAAKGRQRREVETTARLLKQSASCLQKHVQHDLNMHGLHSLRRA